MVDTVLEVLRSENVRYKLVVDDHTRYQVFEPQTTRHLTVADLSSIPVTDMFKLGFGNWDGKIMLIPLWAFKLIADGEELVSIEGDTVVVGCGEIDTDTRFGCIAFGFHHPGLGEIKDVVA